MLDVCDLISMIEGVSNVVLEYFCLIYKRTNGSLMILLFYSLPLLELIFWKYQIVLQSIPQ